MLEFSELKIVGKIEITAKISENDVENIIVNSFEGGSTYWLGFSKSDNKELFSDKPSDEPISTWSTKLLLEGHTVHLFDREDEDERFELTLDKVLKGFKLYMSNHSIDKESWDGESADSIIQYALFGEIVYG